MAKHYASLIGPLLGLYYPLPEELETEELQRRALASSRLAPLWCSIYPEEEAKRQINAFGGGLLPDNFANQLDYDSGRVFHGT